MNVARYVRKIYEDNPYPAVEQAPRDAFWCLPPWAWIRDLWQPSLASPRRILSAGCGTGNEAVAFRRRFPQAEIVGLDFSARSIALARRLQRAKKLRGIRFVVGDLADKKLGQKIAGRFDFISCHGVLAYVPRRDLALQNIADLLTPDGAVYLGINGAAHFSVRWREALREFGFDARKAMPNEPRLPKVIAALDSLTHEGVAPVSQREASFLPTDLFGPLIRNTALKELLAECERSGLHFLGMHDQHAPFRGTVANETYLTLMPRSRAEIAQLVDTVRPAGFHKLLLSKRRAPQPPWENPQELADWRPSLAPHLRKHPLPSRRTSWNALRSFTMRSVVMNIELELRTSERLWEVLRQSRGERSLRDILSRTRASVRNRTVHQHLYLLHQLYLLNFLPPINRSGKQSI